MTYTQIDDKCKALVWRIYKRYVPGDEVARTIGTPLGEKINRTMERALMARSRMMAQTDAGKFADLTVDVRLSLHRAERCPIVPG